jgi:hypothetical protein
MSLAPKSATDRESGTAVATANAAMKAAVRRRRVRSADRASCERLIAAAMFGGIPTRSIGQHWPHEDGYRQWRKTYRLILGQFC